MYALFSETLDGAVTIRAFDQQVRLRYSYPVDRVFFLYVRRRVWFSLY